MPKNLSLLENFISERRLAKIKQVLSKKQPDLTVVLENVHDPHNISAVLRSCDAVGIMEICIIQTKMPGGKFGQKTSASANKWIEMKMFHDVFSCYEYLRKKSFSIFATSVEEASQSLYNLDLTQPIALVFGNEHDGVSKEAKKLADGHFTIPQVGMIESLNISVACAVSIYEVFRQRSVKGFYNEMRISEHAFNEKVQSWIKK